MTNDDIVAIKEKLNIYIRNYDINKACVKGKNPGILTEEVRKKPDFKIPVPFAQMKVDDFAGYQAKPGHITVTIENKGDDEEDETAKELNDVYHQMAEYNVDTLEIPELFKEDLSYGVAYELWWTSEALNIDGVPITAEWKKVPGDQGYPIYTNSLKPVMEKFLYFVTDNDGNEVVTVYMPLIAEVWVKLKDADEYILQDELIEYPYERVPVAVSRINECEEPIFESYKELIKAYDVGVSKSMNEISRFNALIALLPFKLTPDMIGKLKDGNISAFEELNDYEHMPQYMEKNYSGVTEFYNLLLDRIEKLIHKSSKVPDMMDADFSGADESGVSRAFKLLGMEFQASMMEIYFNQGFAAREELFFDLMENTTTLPFDRMDYKFKIDSKRNLPIDVEAQIRIATQLLGLGISRETILKIIPNHIIDNVEKELAREEEEARNNPDLIQDEEESNVGS